HHVDDVGMAHLAGGERLRCESLADLFFLCQPLAGHLDGHVAADELVVRSPDGAHSAFSDGAQQAVATRDEIPGFQAGFPDKDDTTPVRQRAARATSSFVSRY